MTRTTQELADRTMELLGLLEAQETASAEDAASITRAYTDKFAELSVLERVYWPIAEIPNEVFQALARIMAEEVASSFGAEIPIEFDHGGRQVSMGTKGLFDLKRVMQRHPSNLPTKAIYF